MISWLEPHLRCGVGSDGNYAQGLSNHADQGVHQQHVCRDHSDPRGGGFGGGQRERDDENLKSIPIVLPVLGPPVGTQSSIEAGDWLAQVRPYVADVAPNAGVWWDRAVSLVSQRYGQWLGSSALDRLKIEPPAVEEVAEGKVRLEQRITTLLLSAIPQVIRSDLVASRQLHVGGILFAIYKRFQPGGHGERQATLQALTNTGPAKSASEAVVKLREWKRRVLRAQELGASLPDPTIQVKALEVITSSVLATEPQALFRVSSFRMAVQVDNNPGQETTLQFFDMLLSECEQLQYGTAGQGDEVNGNGSTAAPKVKAVKPMQGKGQAGNGSGGGKCRNWGTEAGCRFGKQCRYDHPNLADASTRCWICSSTMHRKNDCPHRSSLQSPGAATGGSESNGEKGGGKSKGKESKGWRQPNGKGEQTTAASATSTTRQSEKTGGGLETGENDKPSVKSTSTETPSSQQQGEAAEGMMTEVTSLLKSLRMNPPQLRAYQVGKMSAGGGEQPRTLLDGGATHCLRAAKDGKEWRDGVPVKVQLAAGNVDMRINATTKTLMVSTSSEPIQQIIPLNKLTDIGYEIRWTKTGCSIQHATRGVLDVRMEQGCPTVNEMIGRALMEEIEEMEASRVALRKVALGQCSAETSEQHTIMELKKLFPEVPLRLLERIPGKHDWSGHELPFNRRRRRQIELAKTVVIHLFAGKEDPRWKKEEGDGVVVVCLDVLGGCDLLHNQHLAGWIEDLARRGKVSAWLAGPPCRTVSALRNKQDGGPPQLRGRGDDRFGLPSLTDDQWPLVDGDSTLWLRMLWWMYLGHTHGGKAEHVIEQPRDPQEWCPSHQWPEEGCPSFMTWVESQEIFKSLGLKILRLDQGALGHPTPKPTMLATDMKELDKSR